MATLAKSKQATFFMLATVMALKVFRNIVCEPNHAGFFLFSANMVLSHAWVQTSLKSF